MTISEFWPKISPHGNVRQETKLGDGEDGFEGVWVDREVVHVLCNLCFQLNQQRHARKQRSNYATLI